MLFFGLDDHLRALFVELARNIEVSVSDRHRYTRTSCPVETSILDAVKRLSHFGAREGVDEFGHDAPDLLLANLIFDVAVLGRQRLVEKCSTESGLA